MLYSNTEENFIPQLPQYLLKIAEAPSGWGNIQGMNWVENNIPRFELK